MWIFDADKRGILNTDDFRYFEIVYGRDDEPCLVQDSSQTIASSFALVVLGNFKNVKEAMEWLASLRTQLNGFKLAQKDSIGLR
jgi:hypothetical protein